MCDECTWHHKTFLVQSVYWHLAIKLYCIVLYWYLDTDRGMFWSQRASVLQDVEEDLRNDSSWRTLAREQRESLTVPTLPRGTFPIACSETALWMSQPWKGKSASTTPTSTDDAVPFTALSTSLCPDTGSSGCPTSTSLSRSAMTWRWKFVTSQNVTICCTGRVGGNLRPECWVLQTAWSLTSLRVEWWRQHCPSSFQPLFLVLHPAWRLPLLLVWKVSTLGRNGPVN